MYIFTLEFLEFYKHAYNAVTQFRHVMGLPIGTQMTEPESHNHTALYIEELTELTQAKTKESQADAIIDSMYVLIGRYVQSGLYNPMMDPTAVGPCYALYQVGKTLEFPVKELFDEIQASNMSKVITDQSLVNSEVELLTSKGLDVEVVDKGGYYVLKASADCESLGIKKGKVLKPSTYQEANLKPLLKQATNQ